MKLIDDWCKAHKLWSVRLSLFGAAASAAWAEMPADTRAMIPGAQWIGLALFLAVALSRVVQQGQGNG